MSKLEQGDSVIFSVSVKGENSEGVVEASMVIAAVKGDRLELSNGDILDSNPNEDGTLKVIKFHPRIFTPYEGTNVSYRMK